MADVKKIVEELAKEAGLNAKGNKMLCQCSTCGDVVKEAEALMMRLTEAHCSTFAWAVAIIASQRMGYVFHDGIGSIRAIMWETDIEDDCGDMGMSPDTFAAAVHKLMGDKKPTKGKIV